MCAVGQLAKSSAEVMHVRSNATAALASASGNLVELNARQLKGLVQRFDERSASRAAAMRWLEKLPHIQASIE
jgi:hypothetical protein